MGWVCLPLSRPVGGRWERGIEGVRSKAPPATETLPSTFLHPAGYFFALAPV